MDQCISYASGVANVECKEDVSEVCNDDDDDDDDDDGDDDNDDDAGRPV